MKPIIFNTQMVQAIKKGIKTQTRLVVKPQPHGVLTKEQALARALDGTDPYGFRPYPLDTEIAAKAPYQKGDVLWVLETWSTRESDQCHAQPRNGEKCPYESCEQPDGPCFPKEYIYKATDSLPEYGGKWHPSSHMPREAARIFLRVTDVRVERLQDMTEDDAFAEGYKGCPAEHTRYFPEGGAEPCFNLGICPFQYWYCQHSDPEGFGRDIWDKTIKPADRDRFGWEANPWVFAYTFEQINKEETEK